MVMASLLLLVPHTRSLDIRHFWFEESDMEEQGLSGVDGPELGAKTEIPLCLSVYGTFGFVENAIYFG